MKMLRKVLIVAYFTLAVIAVINFICFDYSLTTFLLLVIPMVLMAIVLLFFTEKK